MLAAINRRQAAESASNKSRSWSDAAELASTRQLLDKWVLDAEELPGKIQDAIAAELKVWTLWLSQIGVRPRYISAITSVGVLYQLCRTCV